MTTTRSSALRGLSAAVAAVVGRRRREQETREGADLRGLQARVDGLFNAPDHGPDAGTLDDVAGSEFVDDRIRLRD